MEPIQFIQRKDLDEEKWNRCIEGASNGLIYGYSFYLDAMSDQWDALVMGDYEAVMPLPWRRKLGITYCYQPAFTAQLGIFGDLEEPDVKAFIDAIPAKFKLIECSLNHGNNFPLPGLQPRTNFVLPLQSSYEEINAVYRENIRRNIKKSASIGCTSSTEIDIEEVISIAREQQRETATLTSDFSRFRTLFQLLQAKGMAKVYGIMDPNGKLRSSAVFFFSHHRAYYILVGNHPNGRTLGASHALIDAFIRDHARSNLLLDFEGSDLRNLAFFYSSFGAREEQYPFLRIDRLPWYVKLARRR